MQVRDMLFVDDLVDAFLLAQTHMPTMPGQAFNIGGGPANTISLLELLERIGEAAAAGPRSASATGGRATSATTSPTRARFGKATGWRPRVGIAQGHRAAGDWLLDNRVVEPAATQEGRIMKFALVNPHWSFEGSIYFGCREPHLPLEYGYAKALLERGRPRGAQSSTGSLTACRSTRSAPSVADFRPTSPS